MAQGNSQLLDTYRACLGNAVDLLADAELLLERGSYPRAYVLAFTAIEEVVKSQLAADLFTGFIDREEFDRAFRDHRRKIKQSLWATYWAHGAFSELPADAVLPSFPKRMDALYVDIDDDLGPRQPSDSVSSHEARELVRTGYAGLDKIQQWAYTGEQIGTKGFMK